MVAFLEMVSGAVSMVCWARGAEGVDGLISWLAGVQGRIADAGLAGENGASAPELDGTSTRVMEGK